MARSKVVLPPDSTGQEMGITTYDNGTETVGASEVSIVAGDGTPIPASGGTMPVSGTVSVSNLPATQAVTGTFFQATQPVSLASLPALAAGTSNIGDVDVLTLPSITGTVTANAGTNLNTSALALDTSVGALTETAPATDTASSGLNGRLQRIAQRLTSLIALLPASLGQKTKAASLAVTLASDQDTLPVSLASVPSHAVTNAGTFATQAAQSGTWTVQPGNTANTTAWKVDGSAVTQPVSGTFWQATQPVSGTVTANQGGSNWTVNNAQVAGTAIDVNSGNKSAGTMRVVIATDQPALTNKLLVTPDANSSINNAQIGGNTVSTGNGTSGTGVQRVTIASDSTGTVNGPTLTKGTQGSTGFSVQNLTDAGRTFLGFTVQNTTAGTSGTEVMASFSQNKGGSVTGSVTSYTVTNGKRLRLVCLQIAITAQAATVTRLLVNIRSNTAGATVTGSALVAGYDIGGPAVSGQTAYETIPLGEAFEFTGDGTLTIGVSFVPTWTTTAAKVSLSLVAYEY